MKRWTLDATILGIFAAAMLAAVGCGSVGPRPVGPNSVAVLEAMDLNGARQWVSIRGQDRAKPILLFLHGGPGMPLMYLAHAFQRPLERDFIVVQWDRRGAGKSFSAGKKGPMSVTQEIADAAVLIKALLARFEQRQVIIVGHSYGSYLGVALAHAHPDLIRAYVGVGQSSCAPGEAARLQDEWLRKQALEANDQKLITSIDAGGSWDRESALFRYGAQVRTMDSFVPLVMIGLSAPEYNLFDALNVQRGVSLTHARLVDDGPKQPLETTVSRLAAPVYFFLGRHDYATPTACATRYFEKLQAPSKRLVWFENSAHFPFLEQPDAFHEEMKRIANETAP